MTFPPGSPGDPYGPTGRQAPPPWDPRAASQPFSFRPSAGPAPQYPVGPGATGPTPNGPVPNGIPGSAQQMFPGGHPGQQGQGQARPYPPVLTTSRWVVPLRFAAVVLVGLGLSIPFDSSSDWVARTTWAIFAVVAVIVQLLSSAGDTFGWDVRKSWLIGAIATAGLTLHWLLIALPNVGSNSGFCLTFGTAAAVGAMLLAPGRRW